MRNYIFNFNVYCKIDLKLLNIFKHNYLLYNLF